MTPPESPFPATIRCGVFNGFNMRGLGLLLAEEEVCRAGVEISIPLMFSSRVVVVVVVESRDRDLDLERGGVLEFLLLLRLDDGFFFFRGLLGDFLMVFWGCEDVTEQVG